MIVRPATPADAAAIQAIYAHHVLSDVGSFELEPPGVEEMAGRMAAVTGRGMPWRVAEADGRIVAYAYASPFRLRAAYRYTAEDSVYVARDFQRRGAGRAVLASVVEACEALGLRQLIAGIGDSQNTGSIGLHAALGFEHVGRMPGLGWKFDRWCDVLWMQKALNGGTARAPEGDGLAL
jgi:phosphinothricin acetyltransferase